jgi:hypothetical protein
MHKFGLAVKYVTTPNDYWKRKFETRGSVFNNQLIGAFALYRFQSKQKNIELFPEIGFMRSIRRSDDLPFANELSSISFQLDAGINVLRFDNGRLCPAGKEYAYEYRRGYLER